MEARQELRSLAYRFKQSKQNSIDLHRRAPGGSSNASCARAFQKLMFAVVVAAFPLGIKYAHLGRLNRGAAGVRRGVGAWKLLTKDYFQVCTVH